MIDGEEDMDTELLPDTVPLRDCVLHAELVAVAHSDSVVLDVLDAAAENVMVPLLHRVIVGEGDIEALPEADTVSVPVPVAQTELVVPPERLPLTLLLEQPLMLAVRHREGDAEKDAGAVPEYDGLGVELSEPLLEAVEHTLREELPDLLPDALELAQADAVAEVQRVSVGLEVGEEVMDAVTLALAQRDTVCVREVEELPETDRVPLDVAVEQMLLVELPERLLLTVALGQPLSVALGHRVGEEVGDRLGVRLPVSEAVWHPDKEVEGLVVEEAL